MNIAAFTLVLNGMPFLLKLGDVLLNFPNLHWIVCHGAAMNNGSTSWCKKQEPGLSDDGSTEYLHSISCNNFTLLEQEAWHSKDEMVNAALAEIKEPCVLMEIDSDEVWSAEQLATIVRLFEERPQLASIMFACRYFVGPNLILQGEHCYGDHDYEWLRAWRYTPGQRFVRHEPPILFGDTGENRMTKRESRQLGLVFDHYAYATEAQAKYKQDFYGYVGLLEQWQRLQANDQWPVPLSRFFTHVSGDLPLVVKI